MLLVCSLLDLCSRSAQLSKSVSLAQKSYVNAQIFGIMHSRPRGARTVIHTPANECTGKPRKIYIYINFHSTDLGLTIRI